VRTLEGDGSGVDVFEGVRGIELVEGTTSTIVDVGEVLALGVGVLEAFPTDSTNWVKFDDTPTYVSPAPTTTAQTETGIVWAEGAVQENLKDDSDCLELCVMPPAQRDIWRR